MAEIKQRVVIIMPTYNEGKNIGQMIDELVGKHFPTIPADMHLLVVDDNSPDGTGDIVREKSKKYKNIHLHSGEKAGLGAAYVRGMKYAVKELKADAVMEMDADFQHPPRFVKPMVEAYLDGREYFIGSRYIKGGSVPKEWALSRRLISFFGNLFIRIVLVKPKLHDLTTGFRLTKVKGVLDKIDLDNLMELKRFAYKVDLLYQSVKNSRKTVEVPLAFAPRTREKSKFDTKEMIATFKVAIILGIRDKARFLKFATVGLIGFLVNSLGIEFFRGLPLTSTIAASFESLKLGVLSEPSFWAAAFGTELAIISNFLLNNFWTFKEKKIVHGGTFISKFLQFNFTSLGALIIQSVVIGSAVRLFGDTFIVRQLALVFAVGFLVIPYNYAMYNLFIWKTWKLPKIFSKK